MLGALGNRDDSGHFSIIEIRCGANNVTDAIGGFFLGDHADHLLAGIEGLPRTARIDFVADFGAKIQRISRDIQCVFVILRNSNADVSWNDIIDIWRDLSEMLEDFRTF